MSRKQTYSAAAGTKKKSNVGQGVKGVISIASFHLLYLWPYTSPEDLLYKALSSSSHSVAMEMSALQDLTNVQAGSPSPTRPEESGTEKKKTKTSWTEAMKMIVGYKKKQNKKAYTYPPMDPTYDWEFLSEKKCLSYFCQIEEISLSKYFSAYNRFPFIPAVPHKASAGRSAGCPEILN